MLQQASISRTATGSIDVSSCSACGEHHNMHVAATMRRLEVSKFSLASWRLDEADTTYLVEWWQQ